MNLIVSEWIDSNLWSQLWPELSLVGIALVALMSGVFCSEGTQRAVFGASLILGGLVGLVVAWLPGVGMEEPLFGGLLRVDSWTRGMRLFLITAGVLTGLLGWQKFKDPKKLPALEYIYLTYTSTAALMLLSQAQHFIMLFIALETATIGFIVMIAYERKRSQSLEAALKYLVLAGLSSALMLFGIVILYGLVSNPSLNPNPINPDPLSFEALGHFLQHTPTLGLAKAGVLLLLVGVFFKISLAPFHMWVPDVYAGATTPTAAFLAAASKGAGFFVLIRLLSDPGPLAPLAPTLLPLLGALTSLTLLLGNFAALLQKNTQRIMGLSGVAHAGTLMLGVLCALYDSSALTLIMAYLLAYLLASFCVFGAIQACNGTKIQDFRNLSKRSPLMAAVLAIGLGSLAGIPPLLGFTTKATLFIAAFKAELYGFLAVAILGVLLSIYYYFNWMSEAFFKTPENSPEGTALGLSEPLGLPFKGILLLLALATILLGLWPYPVF